MERWYKLNLSLGLMGVLTFIVSMLFFKKLPLFILPAMFGLGIAFKCIKNVYRGNAPRDKKLKRPDYNNKNKKK
ncbi:hypothetical protein [Romboutsia sp.]|uniref:hypothetical protein n=1 Tax=Romboutsia sp. TaxID=1965302 RepID=UPI003F360A96